MARSRSHASNAPFSKSICLTMAVAAAIAISWATLNPKPAAAAQASVGFDAGYERIAEEATEPRGKKKKKKKRKSSTRRGSFY